MQFPKLPAALVFDNGLFVVDAVEKPPTPCVSTLKRLWADIVQVYIKPLGAMVEIYSERSVSQIGQHYFFFPFLG